MISPDLDLAEFLIAIEDKDLHDIIRMTESEAAQAEKIAQLKGHGEYYVEALEDFAHVLRYGQKPLGITEEHFQSFRPICEKLVTKKQLLPDLLALFDSEV